MIRFLVIISFINLLSGCTKSIEVPPETSPPVAEVVEEQQEDAPEGEKTKAGTLEISGETPKETGKKFIVEDQDAMLLQTESPIMIAVMSPMSGKYSMLGNAIMDGAHMALIELFNKHKIPVRLTAIDIGSGIEDMEFNISKLDEAQFDIILGLTSENQKAFVEAYIEQYPHKPKIMSFLEDDCNISPRDQIGLITGKTVYVVLPISEPETHWQGENIKIMQYGIDDPQQTTDDLIKITQKIAEEIGDKQVMVVFTEGNWRLQKFIANLDTLKLGDRLNVILASLSHKNSRMESVNEKRHRFGNIGIIALDNPDYNRFMREFQTLHNRKPLEIAFLSYNAVKALQNSNESNGRWNVNDIGCKPAIKLFEQNYK
jgi:hypothetical protein